MWGMAFELSMKNLNLFGLDLCNEINYFPTLPKDLAHVLPNGIFHATACPCMIYHLNVKLCGKIT